MATQSCVDIYFANIQIQLFCYELNLYLLNIPDLALKRFCWTKKLDVKSFRKNVRHRRNKSLLLNIDNKLSPHNVPQ